MNNKEFISSLATANVISAQQCQKMVNELTDAFCRALEEGNEVTVAGLGNFDVKKKKERIMQNPTNGKKMLVPPRLSLNFKMSATCKNKFNESTQS